MEIAAPLYVKLLVDAASLHVIALNDSAQRHNLSKSAAWILN